MSDVWQGPGYWMASDGKWYSPELRLSSGDPVRNAAVSWGGTGTGTATLPPPVGRFGPDADLLVVGPAPSGRPRRVSRRALGWGTAVSMALVLCVGILVGVSGQSTKWDPRVLALVHFDEQHRGLTFKQPVKVEFLGSAQFNKEVSVPQPTSVADRAAQSRALGELRALGLVHGNVNLAASENKLNQTDVVGLYVDTKKTVFVRGRALTPYVRVTLAHELTHALQDQYFNLDKLGQAATNGDDSALTALVEGDAVRDENLYEQGLSPAEQRAYQDEQNQLEKGSSRTSGVPEILSDMLNFPYAFGPTYVDSLVTQGGTTAIDRAFRDVPVAEAQIVDPVEYPIAWKPARVATPVLGAGKRRLDKPSSFGQVSLFEVLGSRLGYDQAWSAVQGWRGDNSVPYKDHGRTCMAIDVDMGSTSAGAGLAGAARTWAQAVPGATVTQSDKTVELRSCDPGPNAPGPPNITPSAFDVLAARATIIDAIMNGNQVDFAMGKCVADKVLVGVGPSGYGELTASTLPPSQQAQLQQLAQSSAGKCEAQGVS